MTRTFDSPIRTPRHGSRPTPAERAFVLGGLAAAALCTAFAAAMGGDMEAVAFIWIAAGAWAFVSSLALAVRRGLRNRDWSPFRRGGPPDDTELVDWSTQSGRYLDMALAEDNERLMRGD